MSIDKLISRIDDMQNPTVAGLDPKLDYIPSFIKDESFSNFGINFEAAANAVLVFNKMIIDEIYDIVPAIKPQSAYYEALGWQGVRALHETVKYAKSKGMYVIVDGKRNDIGSTMEAYSSAYIGKTEICGQSYEPFKSDALTVNGYLGSDGIDPLLKDCLKNDKMIFVLCKTSNPSSGELQDRTIDGEAVYRIMGSMCKVWGNDLIGEYGYSGVGAVVGATYPDQLSDLRSYMPNTFFLVPGYGAQGGKASDISLAFDNNGRGAIVNSSRALMCAYKTKGYDEKYFAKAAREEALRMKDELNLYRN